ncbi:MAG: hypothetical protein ACRDSF_21215 [Pseudonocardiaceae bacterium]
MTNPRAEAGHGGSGFVDGTRRTDHTSPVSHSVPARLRRRRAAAPAGSRPPGAPTVTPGPSTDDELPAPGVDSLLAFAGLDLRSWAPACT